MQRSSGILLPVSALPSPYGIGTLGKEARKFVDFLAAAKQTYWQVLPLGPTSYGDSPYQCFSSFAGNPYYVDLEELIALGLLKKEEVEASTGGGTAGMWTTKRSTLGAGASCGRPLRASKTRRRWRALCRTTRASRNTRCSWPSRTSSAAGPGPAGRRRGCASANRARWNFTARS